MAAPDLSKMSDSEMMAAVSASLQQAHTQGMGRSGGKISAKEAEDMKNAFSKKEFRDMFRQYLEEISDPAARKVRLRRALLQALQHSQWWHPFCRSKRRTLSSWSGSRACPPTCTWFTLR